MRKAKLSSGAADFCLLSDFYGIFLELGMFLFKTFKRTPFMTFLA